MTDQERQRLTNILETSRDRDDLELAAAALAASDDPASLAGLERLLAHGDGLARLDDLDNPSFKTSRLAHVLHALEQHPSPSVAEVCLRLVHKPDFLADDDRKIYLLPALAAVRPMSEAALEVFRQTNAEGYYNLNALLMVKNGSPNALALLEQMIRDDGVEVERRVDALHAAVLPYRTELAVLQTMNRLVDANLPEPVRGGGIETIFDNRTAEWFGTRKSPPTPPPWQSASDDALRFVLALADKMRARGLPAALLEAVNNTAAEIREILAARRA